MAEEESERASYDRGTGQISVWQPPTEEEFNHDWFTPEDAAGALGYRDYNDNRRWIANRLKVGEIIAVARTSYLNGQPHQRFFGIPQSFWNNWNFAQDEFFWESGDTIFRFERPRTIPAGLTNDYQCHDVRFDPQGFRGVPTNVRPADPSFDLAPGTPSERNKGGRPRNDYWEPLLIEMARQLYTGDLQPKRQADIEKAMHDWLVTQDEKPSETQGEKTGQKPLGSNRKRGPKLIRNLVLDPFRALSSDCRRTAM